MNQSNLIGRPTKSPELQYTPSGVAVATFTLAVQRDFKNASGEYEADFIPVVVWRNTAEYVANHIKKGKLTSVTGRIQNRNYENNEGKTVYITEIIADKVQRLEWDKKQDDRTEYPEDGKPIDISDDDLPF